MNLYQEVTDKLYAYLQPICADAGVPDVVFDYENGVALKGDFVAIDIRSIPSNKPEVVYRLKEGVINDEIVKYRGTVTFGVDVYADVQALFVATQIKVGMAREKAHEEAMKQNIGFVGYGDTLNLTAVQDGKFRARAQFEVLINIAIEFGIDDTTIGTVTVKGDIDGKYLVEEIITE